MKLLRNLCQAMVGIAALSFAEFAHGIKLIKAVHASEFENQLRAVSNDPEYREFIRDWAIKVASLGWDIDQLAAALKASLSADLASFAGDSAAGAVVPEKGEGS